MDIAAFITQYGLEMVVLALVSILFVGIFKVACKKPLEKIEKANRKPIYEVLSIVFTYGIVAIWLVIRPLIGMATGPITFDLVLTTGSAAYVAVKVMYPLYENFKIRDLLQLIGKAIIAGKKTKTIEPPKDNNNNTTIIL